MGSIYQRVPLDMQGGVPVYGKRRGLSMSNNWANERMFRLTLKKAVQIAKKKSRQAYY